MGIYSSVTPVGVDATQRAHHSVTSEGGRDIGVHSKMPPMGADGMVGHTTTASCGGGRDIGRTAG